jgi:hypothetical protein
MVTVYARHSDECAYKADRYYRPLTLQCLRSAEHSISLPARGKASTVTPQQGDSGATRNN